MIKYPDRIPLASLPTPFKKLEKFTVPNFDGTIWIKHDELTGTEVSGNKVRKLEFSIAHAPVSYTHLTLPTIAIV